MDRFCGNCGAEIDSVSGLCPNCDSEKTIDTDNKTDEQNASSCNTCVVTEFVNSEPAAEEKPVKVRFKGLQVTVTVLLSICLFITSFCAVLIYGVRNSVKEDNAEELFNNVSAMNLAKATEGAVNSEVDAFFKNLQDNYNIKMTESKLDKFIQKSTIKPYVAELVSSTAEDFFDGELELTISKSEIVNQLQKNSRLIEKEFDVRLTFFDFEQIADWFFEGDKYDVIENDEFMNEYPAAYYGIRLGLSYITMTVLIVLSVLIIVLMIRNSSSQALCAIGVDFVIIGLISSVSAMLAAWIVPLWRLICSDSVVGMLVGNVAAINAVLSVSLLFIGIVLLVLKIVISKRRAKKQGDQHNI